MVTRAVAKQAKRRKVKNNFINYSVVFLVEGEKFNLGEKVQARSSNLL